MLPDFKTLFVGVRPPRLAILLDVNDQDWQDTCIRILEWATSVWGGKYCAIVPTDGKSIRELFWEELEAFDPDYVFAYHKTLADIKFSKPERYNTILEKQLERFLTDFPGNDPLEARKRIDEELMRSRTDNFEIGLASHDEIKFRLAPFYFEKYVVQPGYLSAGVQASHPLTRIDKIIPYCEHPTEFISINSTCESIPKLWYASVTGCLHSTSIESLGRLGIASLSRTFDEDGIGELIGIGVHNTSNLTFASHFSMTQLGYYRSRKWHDWSEPCVVVAGETLEDFCLYRNLSSLRPRVSWLLRRWLMEFETAKKRTEWWC